MATMYTSVRAGSLMMGVCALLASSSAGGPRAPRPRQAVFQEAEYAPYRETGSGRIEGQVFLRQRGGGVVKGAGAEVNLNPVTSYSTEWFTAWMAMEPLVPADPRAEEFARVTQADAEGRFHFDGLPPGRYYVASAVVWEVPRRPLQGGTVGLKVRVNDDTTTEAMLTR